MVGGSTPRVTRSRWPGLAALALLTIVSAGACSTGSGQEAARPVGDPRQTSTGTATATGGAEVDPGDFVRTIDNPYLPMEPGTTLRYQGGGNGGPEETVVEVTHETRTILGVTVVVVRDTVSHNGEVVEDTRDWFAQDRDGNVWYFGEDSRELKDGEVVSREGSWEAGKDGARPGIVMKADPRVGDTYDQEVAPGVAEDKGEVLSLEESVEVPYGSYDNVVQTRDTTPLEPDVVEHKFYAEGVGLIAEEQVEGGEGRLELVSVERP